MLEQSDYPEKALAELALIELKSKTAHNQIGYWHDLRYKQPDSLFKLHQIANQQTPKIAAELIAWGEKWQIATHGGNREGSGRPSTGRKKHQYYITDDEDAQIKNLINQLRKPSE